MRTLRLLSPATRVALLALLGLAAAHPVAAQRLVFDRPLQVDGIPAALAGDGDYERSRRAVALDQGRTWLTGTREGELEADLFVMRLSATGAVEMQRTHDLGGNERGIAVLPTGDGGAWVAAIRRGKPRVVALVLRIAADGGIVWRFEVPTGGQWQDAEQDLQLFALPGGDLLLGGSAYTGTDNRMVVHLQRLRDLGDRASVVWQSTVAAAPNQHDQLGLDVSPDRTRIAIAARLPFTNQLYVGLVSSASGAVLAAHTLPDQAFSVLPPVFAADGSLRAISESALSRSPRVVRLSAAGAVLGSSAAPCTATLCRPTAAAVTSDGATVVASQDFDNGAALLQRFDSAGTVSWTRSYARGAFNDIREMVAEGTGVAVGMHSSSAVPGGRWTAGRIDAAGQPADASALPSIDAEGAELSAVLRGSDGSLRFAGTQNDNPRRLRVAGIAAGGGFEYLVGPAVEAISVNPREVVRHLHVDALGRPTVVFDKERDDPVVGIQAFASTGAPRWSNLTDPGVIERWHASTMDPDGRVSLATIVGPFPSVQVALRRTTPDGQPDGPSPLFGESGAVQVLVAAAADGSRAIALGLENASVVVRRIGPDGQVAWRTVHTPTGSFVFLESLAFLANGDIALLYSSRFEQTAAVVGVAFARVTGAQTTPISLPTPSAGSLARPPVVDGQRMVFALRFSTASINCFDFTGVPCFSSSPPGNPDLTHTVRDPASGTIYVAGTANTGRPRLIALHAGGAQRFDLTLSDQPAGQGHTVFVRDGQPVLVATRAAPDGSTEGIEIYRISAQGQLQDRTSFNLGARMVLREAAWSEAASRLYLTVNRVGTDGAFGTALVGVALDTPGRIFGDGFD